jgi:hypothetical protein
VLTERPPPAQASGEHLERGGRVGVDPDRRIGGTGVMGCSSALVVTAGRGGGG